MKDKMTQKKMQNKGNHLLVLTILLVILSLSFTLAYTRAYVQDGRFSSFGADVRGSISQPGDREITNAMCLASQDFILQTSPFGCTPSVVRSDLLEEQDVTVFCKISATQINPLIDVEAIDYISITGQYPRGVSSVGYFPGRAALGNYGSRQSLKSNQPFLENIGYATITLRRNPNESSMPDFVEGNLSARITYDVKNAFGVGRSSFYLPEFNDERDWENNFRQYSFWDGRGYLRAESVGDNEATISIYSDRSYGSLTNRGDNTRITSVNLRKGQESAQISMPGFNFCWGGLTLKLQSLENPGTRARLKINGDIFEVKEGERFLDGQCGVRRGGIPKNTGLVQEVRLNCREEGNFELKISPKVKLDIENVGTREYSLGEKLPFVEEREGDKFIYVGYIGTKDGTGDEEDLYVRFVQTPGQGDKLDPDVLAEVARFDNKDTGSSERSRARRLVGWTKGLIKEPADWIERFARFLVQGTRISGIVEIDKREKIYGTQVEVLGFGDEKNVELTREAEDHYEQAKNDYETIVQSFSGERYPLDSEKTLGETALRDLIELANEIGQKQDVLNFCSEFENKYPSSLSAPEECTSRLKRANQASAVHDVTINGRVSRIEFEGINEPTPDEYGAEITISNAGNNSAGKSCDGFFALGIDDETCFSDTEYIRLLKVGEEYVDFEVGVKESFARETFWKTDNIRVKEGNFRVFGENNYEIRVHKINLKKMARVSVNPHINNAGTTAQFPFKIGIEKRRIQLSPEKINEKLESNAKRLETIQGIQTRLEPVVEGFNAACLATSAILTAKNFLDNLHGEGIARKIVMRTPEKGWFDQCKDLVNNGQYGGSIDTCLAQNSDEIDKAVQEYQNAIQVSNNLADEIEKGIKTQNVLNEEVFDTDSYMEKFVDEKYVSDILSNSRSGFGKDSIVLGDETVLFSDITKLIDSESLTVSQARDLQLNSKLLDSSNPVVRDIAKAEVESIFTEVWVNEKNDFERKSFATEVGSSAATLITLEELKEEIKITNIDTWGNVENRYGGGNIDDDSFVYFVRDRSNGQNYLLVLDNSYVVSKTYAISSLNDLAELSSEGDPNPLKIGFKYFDSETYEIPILESERKVRYFESGNYKGLPGLVPFDVRNGWYAAVKSSLPIGGNIKAYDDSGRISSFFLCHVGKNGRPDFNSGIGDDECQGINPATSQPYNQILGLEQGESIRLASCAIESIRQASTARERTSGSRVPISTSCGGRVNLDVGEPMVNIPDIQCQDFMSPFECNLLFNVCDPVICPSSRCDLGGSYPVGDVVQSGVGGSLVLCLPNFGNPFNGGVAVPICLSGVNAGLQGWVSVLDSYQQCLQNSLDTGQTIGVCDEIQSIYYCDMFSRNLVPAAKIIAPKILGKVLGQSPRGGGEYLGVDDAFQKAGDSVDFFKQYYAKNSIDAFNARNTQSAGSTAICKNFASVVWPGGETFDNFISADSPPQFYGRFDEIPFTTATNPPTSQYKVFYHVFAGKDSRAYYEVYLKTTGSSFFRDASFRRVVATGFLASGEYATSTEDFTAPSGYQEMCIIVNGQEECNFKEVSTEFAFTYIKDKYIEDQVTQTNIKSERECISGTPNALDLLNPNIQAGVEDLIDPQLYKRGITRICATSNPGTGSDAKLGTVDSRWKEVGHCGDENLKCWLDMQDIENTIRSTKLEGELLENFADRELESLRNEIEDAPDFKDLVRKIDDEDSLTKVIRLVDSNFNKVFQGFEKAYLLLKRGNAFGELAKLAFKGEGGLGRSGDGKITITTSDGKEIEINTPLFEFRDGGATVNIFYAYSEKDGWAWRREGSWRSVREVDVVLKVPLSEENKAFINLLVGKSYLEGLSELIRVTERNDGRGTLDLSSKLETENVEFFPNSRLKISLKKGIIQAGGIIYWFEYDIGTSRWRWSFNEKTWMEVPETVISGSGLVNFDGTEPIREMIDLIKSLEGKLRLEGMAIIFSESPSFVFEIINIDILVEEGEEPEEPSPTYSSCEQCNDEFICSRSNCVQASIDVGGIEDFCTYEAPWLGKNTCNSPERVGEDVFGESERSSQTSCSDCGTENGFFCGENECELELGCEWIGYFWNKNECIPKVGGGEATGTNLLDCGSLPECRKVLGEEIIKIASELKSQRQEFRNFDAEVRADTGSNSFECLVLQLAYQESGIQQCGEVGRDYEQNGNPLYCEDNFEETLKGDDGRSLGVMQLNTDVHTNVNAVKFVENIKFGVNLLINNYDSDSKEYICKSKSYSGWQRALRNYNGWNTDCSKGDTNYVENVVIDKKDEVQSLFPGICG